MAILETTSLERVMSCNCFVCLKKAARSIESSMEATGDNASLAVLSLLLPEDLRSELLRCCGSPGWVEGMMKRTPFISKDSLFEEATTVWWNLPPSEWHMAFSAHPQIGT